MHRHRQHIHIETKWYEMKRNETKRKAMPEPATAAVRLLPTVKKKFKLRSSSRNLSERRQKRYRQRERTEHTARESAQSTQAEREKERARAHRVSERASKRPPVQTDRETGDHESERAMRTNTAYSEQRDQKGIVRQARERERSRNRKGNGQNTKMQTQSKCMQKYCVFAHALLLLCFSAYS